jgi:peptidoglycan/xylan/chitin deacetylase (PgdA/CDA1 family)
MKRRIKSALFFCLYYSGLERLLARLVRARGVAVIMYHGVCDDAPMPAHINFHVARDVFERQMRALARRYRVVALGEVVAALERGEPLEKAVVLTFDDGYENNARYAAPVLARLGMPATVFVATAYVDSKRWMPLNEIYSQWSAGKLSASQMAELRSQVRGRPSAETAELVAALGPHQASRAAEESFAMLSWDEIRQMAESGVEFGSHTHSHCNMAVESEAQQAMELRVSKELLEQNLGRPVRWFAYPYGRAEHMSRASRRSVIEAGYDCALAGEHGLATSRSDRFRLPRMGWDRRMWMFTGELLYQFAKQGAKDVWSGFAGRALPDTRLAGQAKEHHG